MRVRTIVAVCSALIGLTSFLFWFIGPLLEFVVRTPNWWLFGSLCLFTSSCLVRMLFNRFTVRDCPIRRLLVRYLFAAVVGYVVMAVVVFFGVRVACLVRRPEPSNEGDMLAALMAIWVPLWGLPFGGALGMLRQSASGRARASHCATSR
jgi:hypothetical protein